MRALLCLPASVLLLACSAGVAAPDTPAGGDGGADASGGAGGETGGGGETGAGGQGEGGFGFGGQGGGAPIGDTEVFGHSSSTLYKLDPVTKEVTTVGAFSGCNGSVVDIALDKDGQMVGTTFGGLYAIDKMTAECTLIKSGRYPNSLSFVPAGTLDPDVEALVGFEGTTYVRIFPDTGESVEIGKLDGGYFSSGDVVSVIGGGTYLTVVGGPSSNCSDCLIQVDPSTGAFIKNVGELKYSSVWGLAFWGGAAYGFDAWGHVFQIDLTNAATTDIVIPGAPPNLTFYGAGSSTSAPLEPPQ